MAVVKATLMQWVKIYGFAAMWFYGHAHVYQSVQHNKKATTNSIETECPYVLFV